MPIRLTVALLSVLLFVPESSSAQVTPAWPTSEWPRSAPEAQGMSSAKLVALLEQIESDNPGIHSVSVVRHGTVVLDTRVSPFQSDDRHDIHSCTKSVLSALVGIAIDKGDLPGLDTPVLDFFPGREIAHLDADKRALTLGHLLMMSAGLKTEDSYLYDWAGLGKMRASRDWTQYILDLPIEAEPGTHFEYSNAVSQLIAIILQEATGQSAAAYAREHLFGPIGIVDYAWEDAGPYGSLGYSGLSLHPLDMARLGYLYLRSGKWEEVQVIPADWVESSTSPQITAGTMAESYGYQWWVDGDVFTMQGYGGQLVFVSPARDLVVVFTSALPQRDYFTPRSMLSNYIEAAVIADHALPANPAAVARLDSLVRVLGSGTVEPLKPLPDLAQSISGRTFEFPENDMGLRHLILQFPSDSSEAKLEFIVGPTAASMTIGLDGVFRISEIFGQRWACRGRWVNGETFILEQEALGKVLRRRATLSFEGNTLSFEIRDQVTGSIDTYGAKTAAAPPVTQ